MAKHYKHAPISEAAIEFRVKLSGSTSVRDLEKLSRRVDDNYPVRKPLLEFRGELHGGDSTGAQVRQTQIGYRFLTKDGKQILQASTQNFLFSRLAPYDRWKSVKDEARRLWDEYSDVGRPEAITRIGLRYINKIDLPSIDGGADLQEYFNTFPEVAPDLPQRLTNFFMRVEIPQPEISGMLVITQTAIDPSRPDVTSIVLDIDAFVDQCNLGADDAWLKLEDLRDVKNSAFEACITDKVREMIS